MEEKSNTVNEPSECETASKENRRQHERFKTDIHVLILPTEDQLEGFWASAQDISCGGMFINTKQELPLYCEVRARIVPQGAPSVSVVARVVRASVGKGFGCCFVDMAPKSSYHLYKWLGRSGGLHPVSGTIQIEPSKQANTKPPTPKRTPTLTAHEQSSITDSNLDF